MHVGAVLLAAAASSGLPVHSTLGLPTQLPPVPRSHQHRPTAPPGSTGCPVPTLVAQGQLGDVLASLGRSIPPAPPGPLPSDCSMPGSAESAPAAATHCAVTAEPAPAAPSRRGHRARCRTPPRLPPTHGWGSGQAAAPRRCGAGGWAAGAPAGSPWPQARSRCPWGLALPQGSPAEAGTKAPLFEGRCGRAKRPGSPGGINEDGARGGPVAMPVLTINLPAGSPGAARGGRDGGNRAQPLPDPGRGPSQRGPSPSAAAR